MSTAVRWAGVINRRTERQVPDIASNIVRSWAVTKLSDVYTDTLVELVALEVANALRK